MTRKNYAGEMFDRHLRLAQMNLQGEALRVTESLFKRAGLFCFDYEELRAFSIEYNAKKAGEKAKLPNLPFPVTAIEREGFCSVIMTRSETDGSYVVQLVMFQEEERDADINASAPTSIIVGAFFNIDDCTWDPESVSFFNNKGRFLGKKEKPLGPETIEALNVTTSWIYYALAAITSPDKFVVEVEPRLTRKRSKEESRKPLPARERPNFIMLEPLVIRKLFTPATKKDKGDETGEHSKKPGHYRRGYERWFMHERYTNMRGKSQWVEAVWVGPQEAVVNGRRYKVRLDV